MSRATQFPRTFAELIPSGVAPLAHGEISETERLEALLARLYRMEAEGSASNDYLRMHAEPNIIRGHVRAFLWYRSFLPSTGAILDWGCNHAPDSCLLRDWGDERFELHGSDFRQAGAFPAFHGFARLEYAPLTNNLTLPYQDERFDAVIGSGVLEHTAMDYEALKEVYRVLRPQGTLIVTYLPNWLSHKEWFLRNIRGHGYHRRTYSIRQTCALLRHAGFDPVFVDYQSFLWNKLFGSAGSGWTARLLDLILPARRFASTLRLVARKVHGF
jgi:SAM-dependent methyltransferase